MSWVKETVGKVAGIIEKAVPDTTQANALKSAISSEIIAAGSAAVLAEASGNWLQRSWRPITALTFVFLIFNNYFIIPYLNAILAAYDKPLIVPKDIPDMMWALLQIMIGGFVISRGSEKVAKIMKGGQ